MRRLSRMVLATAAITGLFTTGLVMVPEQALAAATCEEGNRDSSADMARDSHITAPVYPVYGGNAAVKLRYSGEYGCVWGWVNGPNTDVEVWLDRSSDNGTTWEGQIGKRNIQSGNTDTYTAPLRVGAGASVRACGRGWWTETVMDLDDEVLASSDGSELAQVPPVGRVPVPPGRGQPFHPGGNRGVRMIEQVVPGPIVCTAWFPRVPSEEDCDTVGAGVPGAVESGLPVRPLCALPEEAAEVLAQTNSGRQAASGGTPRTFRNNEQLLPEREVGYYSEHTVLTPHTSDRWKRRLVIGKDGGPVYFTDDHYGSFIVVDTNATGSA